MFMHLPHFSRFEHTPREFDTSGVGSQLSLAVSCTNYRFAKVSVVTF